MINVKAHIRKTKKGQTRVRPHTRNFKYLGHNISVSPRQYTRTARGTGWTEYHLAKDSYDIVVDSGVWMERIKGSDIQNKLERLKQELKLEKKLLK